MGRRKAGMGPVSAERRRKVIDMVLANRGLTHADVHSWDVTFTGQTEMFVARANYTMARGGGYQIFEGILGYSVAPNTPVMGKGRSTPRFPLKQTMEPTTAAELIEKERLLRVRLDYAMQFDDDRVD